MFLAMIPCVVQVEGAFGLHCFFTYFAFICERSWEVNTFYMVHNIVFLSINLATKSALETS